MNSRIDIENIKTLIEKYHECETTVAEEKFLAEYFNSSDVADELKQYKQYFCETFEVLDDTEFCNIKSENKQENKQELRSRIGEERVYFVKHWKKFASIAAVAVLLLAVSSPIKEKIELQRQFKGSYIKVNGKKIYDYKKIREAYLSNEKLVAQIHNEANEILNEIKENKKEYEEIISYR